MSDYDIELPGKVFVRIERSERKRGVTTGPKTDYVVKVPDKPETVVPSLSGLFMYLKGYYPDSADVEEARRIMNRFLKNKVLPPPSGVDLEAALVHRDTVTIPGVLA